MSADVAVGVGTRAALDSLPFDNPTITYRERELIRAAVLAVLALLTPSGSNVQRYDIRHAYASAGPGDYVQRAAHFDAVMGQPVIPDVTR